MARGSYVKSPRDPEATREHWASPAASSYVCARSSLCCWLGSGVARLTPLHRDDRGPCVESASVPHSTSNVTLETRSEWACVSSDTHGSNSPGPSRKQGKEYEPQGCEKGCR